jgi:hypothetical protein
MANRNYEAKISVMRVVVVRSEWFSLRKRQSTINNVDVAV